VAFEHRDIYISLYIFIIEMYILTYYRYGNKKGSLRDIHDYKVPKSQNLP
jgi:hypothetical protein